MKDIIEIKPTGSYFGIDKEGYLINPASEDKLQEQWKPAIDDLVEAYKENHGEHLESIYVRGSVAKGKAIDYVSDIDAFAYVNLPKDEISSEWKKAFRETMKTKYPFIDDVELMVIPNDGKQLDLILNQSLLVYGKEQAITKIKFGKDLILHANRIDTRLEGTLKRLEESTSEDDIKDECQWAMKGIVRIGLELVLERSGKYSRDLYPCYEVFSEYYPEKEGEMREALHLALNPTGDKEKIREVIGGIGMWLQEEIKREL